MATPRRIHAAPHSAVLYVYDSDKEEPQVEPSSESVIVILPSSLDQTLRQELEAFFVQATEALGLKTATRAR